MGRADLAGAAHLELVSGVVQLRPEDAMVEAMLRGWRAQQTARGLREDTIDAAGAAGAPVPGVHQRVPVALGAGARGRVDAVADRRRRIWRRRRSAATRPICGCSASTSATAATAGRRRARRRSGRGHPVPICHEWNTIAHLNDYEGRPGGAAVHPRGVAAVPRLRRRAGRAGGAGETQGRAGRLPGRHAVQGDLRRGGCGAPRRRSWMWSTGAATRRRRSSAGSGCCTSATARRCAGSRRGGATSPSVMGWAVEAVADYVDNIRPRFGCEDHPALWVTERGGRIKPAEINARFVAYRDALGLPKALSPHQSAALVRHPPDRGRGGPPVHPGAGRAPLRHLDGDLHPCQRRLHEHRAAQGARPGARRPTIRPRKESLNGRANSTTAGTCGR